MAKGPLTKIPQRRPKYRWEDKIKQDIYQMKIKNWIAGNGKRLLRRPKLSTIKGSSVPGRRRSMAKGHKDTQNNYLTIKFLSPF